MSSAKTLPWMWLSAKHGAYWYMPISSSQVFTREADQLAGSASSPAVGLPARSCISVFDGMVASRRGLPSPLLLRFGVSKSGLLNYNQEPEKGSPSMESAHSRTQ